MGVPIAQCILEHRPCPACLPAAQTIANAVHLGMAPEQVRTLYRRRYDLLSVKTIPLEGSPSRGPENASVVVVEFADFECPFCRSMAPQLDQIWERRKDKLRFVYKFMPLTMHTHSKEAARAAIAAQMQGKFWEMSHELFTQKSLEQQDLERYAKALGLDVDRFRVDMQSPATTARLEADQKVANDLGVTATPTLYINGRQYTADFDLTEWLDQELAEHH